MFETSGQCLYGVWKVSGKSLKSVSDGCKEGVLSTERRCLESVKIQIRTGKVKAGHVWKGYNKGEICKDR